MPDEARRLSAFPRNELLDEPVLSGKVSELALLERLGAPTAQREGAAFEDPRQFWDLEWPCGLIMGLEYHQLSEDVIMRLDALDIDHALRHLGIEVRGVEASFDDKRDRFDRLNPRPVQGTWAVMVTDHGQQRVVARNLTERDASCRARELDAQYPALRHHIEQAP